MADAMASICNDEWVRLDVMSGHEGQSLGLSRIEGHDPVARDRRQ